MMAIAMVGSARTAARSINQSTLFGCLHLPLNRVSLTMVAPCMAQRYKWCRVMIAYGSLSATFGLAIRDKPN
jgi:hypothetical protein